MTIKPVFTKMIFIPFVYLILFSPLKVKGNDFYNRLKSQMVVSDSSIMWEQVSPGNSGFANLLRYHPTIPHKVAFCQDMWNHYQSDDNGQWWYSTRNPDGDGSFGRMLDIEYGISSPETAIAIATSELWLSQDTGRTFEVVLNCPWYQKDTDGTDKSGWKKKVAAVAIDPNNANVWYVAGGSNVRGQDWMSCYQDINASNPRGKSAENEGKLWKTTNAGQSWSLINNGLNAKAQVGRIIVNPKNSQHVFASSNYGVYKSTNGGNSWTHISDGKLDNDIIMDMDYYYNKESGKFLLYVIDQVHYLPYSASTQCSGGIFFTADEGVNWTNINGDLGLDIRRLSGGVPDNYYKYIAAWFGITQNEAKNKYPQLPVQALQYFNMLSTDPSREGALYIGFADPQVANSIMPGRVWTTSNNGQKWINTARLYEDSWAADRAYWNERGNPIHENMQVGHSSPHMRFGTDYALRSTRGLDVGVDGSVMIISDHSTMLSTDHGVSWKQVDEDYTPSGAIVGHGNSNLPALTIEQDKRHRTTLLGSGEHNLWIPTDDSPDHRQAIKFVSSTQPTVMCMAFDPYDGKKVYATSSRQEYKQNIFRSDDGGENWVNHGVATPATNKWLDDFYTNALTIDPINNQYMYHGITDIVDANKGTMGGFFRSEDFGKTFQQSNQGLPSPVRINDIKFDPRDYSMKSLFIAAQNQEFSYNLPLADGGLFHSTDRGKNWTKINLPTSIKGVQFIEFDHTNRMYITTAYRGAGDGVWYSDNFGKNWTQVFPYEGAECIDVSPFDHNFLVVTCRYLVKNPGVFVSRDRGQTWSKSNRNIVIPEQIEDIKFDLFEANKMWLATKGTGFYRGTIKNGDQIQVINIEQESVESRDGNHFNLTASIVNSNYANKAIVWKSENPAIAIVDENGKVTPISKGHTKIWATTSDGRFSDYTAITVFKASGTKKSSIYSIKVFPNPAQNYIYIQWNESRAGTINFELINTLGKQIINKRFNTANQMASINLQGVKKGMYFIKIETDNHRKISKLVVN